MKNLNLDKVGFAINKHHYVHNITRSAQIQGIVLSDTRKGSYDQVVTWSEAGFVI